MKEMIAARLQGERGGAGDPLLDERLCRGKELPWPLVETGPRGQLNWARILRETFHDGAKLCDCRNRASGALDAPAILQIGNNFVHFS